MAKKSAIQRNLKRVRLIEKYAKKRAELKAIIADPNTDDEAFCNAGKINKLPKNSSPIRAQPLSVRASAGLHP